MLRSPVRRICSEPRSRMLSVSQDLPLLHERLHRIQRPIKRVHDAIRNAVPTQHLHHFIASSAAMQEQWEVHL